MKFRKNFHESLNIAPYVNNYRNDCEQTSSPFVILTRHSSISTSIVWPPNWAFGVTRTVSISRKSISSTENGSMPTLFYPLLTIVIATVNTRITHNRLHPRSGAIGPFFASWRVKWAPGLRTMCNDNAIANRMQPPISTIRHQPPPFVLHSPPTSTFRGKDEMDIN